jgi:hypothetical protein
MKTSFMNHFPALAFLLQHLALLVALLWVANFGNQTCLWIGWSPFG